MKNKLNSTTISNNSEKEFNKQKMMQEINKIKYLNLQMLNLQKRFLKSMDWKSNETKKFIEKSFQEWQSKLMDIKNNMDSILKWNEVNTLFKTDEGIILLNIPTNWVWYSDLTNINIESKENIENFILEYIKKSWFDGLKLKDNIQLSINKAYWTEDDYSISYLEEIINKDDNKKLEYLNNLGFNFSKDWSLDFISDSKKYYIKDLVEILAKAWWVEK